ncbi:MAG: glycosyltransferase family 39 protein [Deltaproteobacteria bacterium]|nr:glycosyltransferase family 39 protein [Deltaproteobacteria bacterium]
MVKSAPMSDASPWRPLLLAIAIAVALVAQARVHDNPNSGFGWALYGAAALLAALVAGRRGAAAPLAAPPRPRLGVDRLLLGAAAIGAVATTTWLGAQREHPVAGLALWLAAVPLACLAVRGWQLTPARAAAPAWTRNEGLALALVLLVAALARVLWLESLPRGIFGDEPRVAAYLQLVFPAGQPRLPSFFVMGWNTWPTLGMVVEGLFAPLIGLDVTALRASSALMGTLGVLCTYLLARELGGPRLALCAAALLAICRTGIDFSRLGIAHAQILFLEPLAFFHLWRAINRGRAVHWLMAGFASGWCLYSYNAGQLVPPLVAGWLLLAALRRPTRLRSHGAGAALLVVGFGLALFPYAIHFTDAFQFGPNWQQWTIMARNRQTLGRVSDALAAGGVAPAWEILARQIWITWLGFGVLPGGGYGLGYRNGGMVDDVTAALFVLGLALALRRLRHGPNAFLLYWWLLTVLVGGIATVDPPSFVRMVGVIPAVTLLAALPLDGLLAGATAPAARRALVRVAVAGLVAAAAWINWQTYFVSFAGVAADSSSELVRYVEARPAAERAVLLGAEHHLGMRREMFDVQLPGRGSDVAEPSHFLPLHEALDAPLTLILGPAQRELSAYVETLYPGSEPIDVAGPNGQPFYFRALHITPEQARARTGLRLRAERPDATAELVPIDPFAALPPELADAEQLSWSGSLYWPSFAPVEIVLSSARAATLTIGTAAPLVVAAGDRVRAELTLPRGWQPIHVEESGGGTRRLEIGMRGEEPARPLTRWQLRPEQGEGLRATYRRPDGSVYEAIDPALNSFAVEVLFAAGNTPFLRMPFTAAWRGALKIDTPGDYSFDAIGSGPFAVTLDGRPLLAARPEAPEDPITARATRHLDAGLHPITATFDASRAAHTSRRVFQLYWTPPGGERELVPPSQFVLSQE